ncbi:MAG: bifunctional riboflavin kinase/FAD synthetase [Geobacter sp.]|nr:bifunctional riboflavin kinase/FAD synthetase [Geobacter sp.]
MEIFRSLDDIPTGLGKTVVTIGNFDGIHLGHREIFRRVRRAAAAIHGVSVVITFVPHPLKVIPNSKKQICLINTYAEKENLISASGIDYLVAIPFTKEFAGLSAREFITDVLVKRLGVSRLIIGYDYSFGRDREGKVAMLAEMGHELGFAVEVLEPIGHDGEAYSSTQVRKMIKAGEVDKVVPLLGRQYSLSGIVVSGHHRGSGLGFPTANILTEKELIPKSGVYAVKVKLDNTLYDGACNIGANPTFGNEETSIEVFLFDFTGDLYGRELRFYFIARIRDERRFPDPEALRQAITLDVARCREILSTTELIEYHEYLQEEADGIVQG